MFLYNSLAAIREYISFVGIKFLQHEPVDFMHSVANSAPFTVAVFNLFLVLVLKRLILLKTLSHSAFEWG